VIAVRLFDVTGDRDVFVILRRHCFGTSGWVLAIGFLTVSLICQRVLGAGL
jgi:hypothetical protein